MLAALAGTVPVDFDWKAHRRVLMAAAPSGSFSHDFDM